MSLLDAGVSPLATHVGHINALIYGSSGTGKTTVCATIPGKIAFLSSEKQGALAVKSEMIERGRDPDSIRIFALEEKEIDGKKVGPRTYLDMLLDELERDPQDFTAVVLDSITDVQNALVTSMKMKKGGLNKPLTQSDWGYIIDSTRNLCIRLRDMKLHTFVIALSTETQDDNNNVIHRPNLVGKKLPNDIPQYFNIVCFMDKEWEKGAAFERFIARMRSSSSRIYTKGHRCLASEEVPDIAVWLQKLSDYWSKHGQEALPTKSEVTNTEPKKTEVTSKDAKINERLKNEKTVELFKVLSEFMLITDEKKIQTLKKYKSDEKLHEVLNSQIDLAKKKAAAQDGKGADSK